MKFYDFTRLILVKQKFVAIYRKKNIENGVWL